MADYPLEEKLTEALAVGGFDATDAEKAVKAILISVHVYGLHRYGAGVTDGDKRAREQIGKRIGVIQ